MSNVSPVARSEGWDAPYLSAATALASFGAGFVLLFLCIGFVMVGGAMGALLALIACLAVFLTLPTLTVGSVIVLIMFQNAAIALVSDGIADQQHFYTLQALNFIILVSGGISGAAGILSGRVRCSFGSAAFVLLIVLFLYFIYGLLRSDIASASSYLRLFTIPVLGLLSGFAIRNQIKRSEVSPALSLAAIILVLWSVFEVLWPVQLYNAFNIPGFYAFKTPTFQNVIDAEFIVSKSLRSWLNFTGEYALKIALPRLSGPNLHPISFAYSAAMVCVALIAFKRLGLAALTFLLVLFVGAKGPIFICAMSLASLVCLSALGSRRSTNVLLGLAGLYVAGVLTYGLYSRDVHVLGLIKGLETLVRMPVGHGLGVGGNLSAMAKAGGAFYQYRSTGAPFALESGWGVLIYQIGVFGVGVLGLGIALALKLMRQGGAQFVFGASLLALIANGFFQEEAFSPAAAGLLLFLVGLFYLPSTVSAGKVSCDA